MFLKMVSILKIVCYKIKYCRRIKISFLCLLNSLSKIKIKRGYLNIKKRFKMKSNSRVSVINSGNMEIGECVSINYNSIIVCRKKILIGNYVSIGPNVCIYDHDHKFNKNGMQEGYNASDVIIEDNVWIGANCVILRGTRIGKNTVIGAGCVIKGKIPSNSLVKSNRENSIEKLHD